jgi:hypothetical protein
MYIRKCLFTYMHTYNMYANTNIYINTGKDNFYGRSAEEDMPKDSKDLVQTADYRGTLRLVISCAPLRNEMGSVLPAVLCPMQCGAAYLQAPTLKRKLLKTFNSVHTPCKVTMKLTFEKFRNCTCSHFYLYTWRWFVPSR